MNCIDVSSDRVGAVVTTAAKVADQVTGVTCTRPSLRVEYEAAEGIGATALAGHIGVLVSHVCTPSIRNPYLEIQPELIWVYPDWAVDNDVLSNTTWHIN